MNLADLVAALQAHLHASLYWSVVWLATRRTLFERRMAMLRRGHRRPGTGTLLASARLCCLGMRSAEYVLAGFDRAVPHLAWPLVLAAVIRAFLALPSYSLLAVANYTALVLAVYFALDFVVRLVPPRSWPARLTGLPEPPTIPPPQPPHPAHTLPTPNGDNNKGSISSRRRRTIPTIRIDTTFADERLRIKRRLRQVKRQTTDPLP